ncbi:MAG: PQQ-dependent sugar dehydrogenase, partial [Vicinamibacterales bacterium]
MRAHAIRPLAGFALAAACGLAAVSLAAQQRQAAPVAADVKSPAPKKGLGAGPWTFETAHYTIAVTRLATLERPWSLAFLPDGAMLVTERPGRLRIIRNGVLDAQPIPGVPKVLTTGFDG